MNITVDDRAWRDLMSRLGGADDHVKVGILGSKGGGKSEGGSDLTVAGVAIIHEFGSDDGKITERSFIRRTLLLREREIAAMQARLTAQVVEGNLSLDRALELLGAYVAGEVKKLIAEGDPIPPPLAESTVERKGSTRPLVDKGQLVNTVSFEVST